LYFCKKEREVEENTVYSKDIIEFVTVAAEYCSFVEATDKETKANFLHKSQKLLSALYLKASLLPKFEAIYEEGNEKFVAEEDWIYIKDKVQQKLAKHEIFLDIYAAHMALEQDAENVSLSEIFADIYQDLMDFITLYRIGHEESMNDALWECQQNFQQYWGQRLLVALTAIHNIIFGGDDLSDESEEEKETEERDTSDWIFTQRQKDWGYNE
jgi:hypothetical protein